MRDIVCLQSVYTEVDKLAAKTFLLYSGTPLIRPPTGHGNLAVLTGWPYKRGRVKFHDWSTSSDFLTDTHHN